MKWRKIKKYNYQLLEDEAILLSKKLSNINTEFINITGRKLICRKYYAWDGLSGPIIHTKRTKAGSLMHDALYQLMRENLLSRDYRRFADKELERLLIKYGMNKFLARIVFNIVDLLGKKHTYPRKKKEIEEFKT